MPYTPTGMLNCCREVGVPVEVLVNEAEDKDRFFRFPRGSRAIGNHTFTFGVEVQSVRHEATGANLTFPMRRAARRPR